MNFINPLALFGLFAAGIPVLLHLLNLRKLKTVDFSTLKFLKELQKTKIRKLKLKQIILLILRTLLIIFAVMAFARPTIEGTIPGLETYTNTSSVILLDNSFSMDISDHNGNRFNYAGKKVREILNSMKEGDESAIIPMSGNLPIEYTLSSDIELLKDQAALINVFNSSSSLDRTLKNAGILLSDAKNLNREIYIISDAQENIFDLNDTFDIINTKSPMMFVPVAEKSSEVQNLSVDSINVVTKIFSVEKLVEVEAFIKNNSGSNVNAVVVSLVFNGERVAQRAIDLPAGETRSLTIAAKPDRAGDFSASVVIEGDALEIDNKRYFGFYIPPSPSVALISEKKSARFIKSAIEAVNSESDKIRLQAFEPEKLQSINPDNFDMIILASGPVKESDAEILIKYTEKGGSLLIFANDMVLDKAFNKLVSGIGLGIAKPGKFNIENPGKFSSLDKLHPLFEGVFKGETNNKSLVESPEILKYNSVSSGNPIISIPGASFLSESKLGTGRILYSAVSADTDWSNFPVTGLFPTLIYRSIYYLTSAGEINKNTETGKPFMLSLPMKFSAGGDFRIISPDGTESFRSAAKLGTRSILQFDDIPTPGVNIIKTANGKTIAMLTANVPASESKIDPLEADDIIRKLEPVSGGNEIIILKDDEDMAKNIIRARAGTELWQLFIIAAILAAVAEMLVERNSKNDIES